MKHLRQKNEPINTIAPFFQKKAESNSFVKNESSFFNASAIQAKSNINKHGDAPEKEADTIIDKQVQPTPIPSINTSSGNAPNNLNIQKKCATCGQEEDKKIQKKEANDKTEIAKTVPQPTTPAPPVAAARFIVDDNILPGTGQMRKEDFLIRLKAELCITINQALTGSAFTADNCPYLQMAFARFQNNNALKLEQLLTRYEPSVSFSLNVYSLIQRLNARAFVSAKQWLTSGAGLSEAASIFGNIGAAAAPVSADATTGKANLFFKTNDAGANITQSPQSVMQSLGKGSSMNAGTRSKMENAFGASFSNVEIHTDENAARLSDAMNARAFTVGNHIAFASGEHQPGSLTGDALLAHELAHTIQQNNGEASTQAKDGGNDSTHEKDADDVAVNVVGNIWGKDFPEIANDKKPQAKSKLRLQRCSYTRAPGNLIGAESKAAWITNAMKNVDYGTEKAVVEVFKSAESGEEFIEIQEHLDMEQVISSLNDWHAVLIGAMGPIIAGKEKLNEKRAAYIVRTNLDLKMPEVEVFVAFMFTNLYVDDMKRVLELLANDNRLGQTIGEMPVVKEIIQNKGIDLTKYNMSGGSFFRGMGQGIKDIFKNKNDTKADSDGLPEEYLSMLQQIEDKQLNDMMSPGSLILSQLDYIAFNVPGGLYGLGKNTISGVKDLAQGNTEKAGEEFTAAAVVILTHIVSKGLGRISAKKNSTMLFGPEGPNQFVIKGFEGPIPPEVAKLGAVLAMNAEANAAAGLVISRIGMPGLLEVAKYVDKNAATAYFVYKNGLPAVEALFDAKGDLIKANEILPSKQIVPVKPVPPPAQPLALAAGVDEGTLFEQQLKAQFAKKIITMNEAIFDENGLQIGEIDFETTEALCEVGLSLEGKLPQLMREAELAAERSKRLDVFYDAERTPAGRLDFFKKALRKKFGNRVRFIPRVFKP